MWIQKVADLPHNSPDASLEFITIGYCDDRPEEYKALIQKLVPSAIFHDLFDDVHGRRVMVFAPRGTDHRGIPAVTAY